MCNGFIFREETEKIWLNPERSDAHPFLGLAFKLEVSTENALYYVQPFYLCNTTKCHSLFIVQLGKFGQLTYMRIYQGRVGRGDTMVNTRTGRPVRVGKLVRLHADQLEVCNCCSYVVLCVT